jgi:BirA family transcriptional regulator, biotin operon repressor / biotin---[acetyl-CoA-carboxylase] ligase
MKDNTVPLKLIALLANGEFHSGEQLGETLGMSRAAINKHIQTLRDWGVDVFTVPGKGYSLPEPIQLLNAKQILGQLDGGSVAVLPVIDSTNQYLLDRIGELKSGDACVAEYQQAGRGRRGRKWFSPFGANLYLSMFWRLEQGPAAAIGLSLVIDLVECASSTAVGFSQYGSDCSGQRCFTMVNVADSTDVNVRFCTFKLFFRHRLSL